MNTLLIAVFSIVLSVAAQFSLKTGMSHPEIKSLLGQPFMPTALLTILTNPFVAGGFFLFRLLPPLHLPRIKPLRQRQVEKTADAAGVKKKQPRPDQLLRLVARGEAGTQRKIKQAKMLIRRSLERRKKAPSRDGQTTGNGQEKI